MKINDIRANIIGDYGLASSNKYHIAFVPSSAEYSNALQVVLGIEGQVASPIEFENGGNSRGLKLSFLADEINIPGFSIATGDLKGAIPGINARYAHTKAYNELNITFMLDMDHTPYKFMQRWSDFMFENRSINNNNINVFKIPRYYDEYCLDVIIEKIEPNAPWDPKYRADNSLNSRSTHNSVTKVKIVKAFPYTMSNISFSNGPNQPVKFQTSFYYEHMVDLETIDPTPDVTVLP